MSIKLWNEQIPFAQGGSDEDIPCITPYVVKTKQPTPAIVVCPGGGYARRADHEGEPIAKWLNSFGVSAFVLSYRVAPYQHPVPFVDAQRAVRLVRYHAAKWNIDTERVGILGFSAGGHLAATVATQYNEKYVSHEDQIDKMDSRPNISVLAYPVISFEQSITHEGSLQNLLGSNPSESLIEQLSADLRVTEHTSPTFLWHTADDASVPMENSMRFAMALKRHSIPFELHVFESGRHGLGLAADHPEAKTWPLLCEQWLRRHKFYTSL